MWNQRKLLFPFAPPCVFLFLQALGSSHQTRARHHWLLMLFNGEFILARIQYIMPKGRLPDPQSALAQTKGTVSYGSPKHGVTEKSMGWERSGEQRGTWQLISPWGNQTQTLSPPYDSCLPPLSALYRSLFVLTLNLFIYTHFLFCLTSLKPTCTSQIWRGHFTIHSSMNPQDWALWLWPDLALIKHN